MVFLNLFNNNNIYIFIIKWTGEKVRRKKTKEEKKERGQNTGVAEGKMLHAFGRPIDPPNDLYFA